MEEKSSRVISLLNIAGLDDRYLSSVDKLNLNRSINFQLIRKKWILSYKNQKIIYYHR